MPKLTNLTTDELYLLAVKVKTAAAQKMVVSYEDILTLCNEFLHLLDKMPIIEESVKLRNLSKEYHNLLHNMRGTI